MVSSLRPPSKLTFSSSGIPAALPRPAVTDANPKAGGTVHAGMKRKLPIDNTVAGNRPQAEIKRRPGVQSTGPVSTGKPTSRPVISKVGVVGTVPSRTAASSRRTSSRVAARRPANGRVAKVSPKVGTKPIAKPVGTRVPLNKPGVPRIGVAAAKSSVAGRGVLQNDENKYEESESPSVNGDDSDDEPRPIIKKRKPGDIKGQIEDLKTLNAYLLRKEKRTIASKNKLKESIDEKERLVKELELEKDSISEQAQSRKKTIDELNNEIDEIKADARKKKISYEDEIDDLKRAHRRKVDDLQAEYDELEKRAKSLKDSLENTEAELKGEKEEVIRLQGNIKRLNAEQLEQESNYRTLKSRHDVLEETIEQRNQKISDLETDLRERNETIANLEAQVRKEEMIRRRLHNTIQELKGNIRVFCRVRPLLDNEAVDKDALPIKFPECEEDNEIELLQQSESAMGKTSTKTFPFKFDKVFGSESTQDGVFEEVSQLIQSALDGYPVCIFAYGQTGSGKTFTMEGAKKAGETNETLGIIPRAVRQIYETTEMLRSKGWEYTLDGQFVEIYNETIQDLLASSSSAIAGAAETKNKKVEVHKDKGGRTVVSGATTTRVDSPDAVNKLLERAAKNRTVAATQCNDRSSRSHSVFMLKIQGHNAVTSETCTGMLNLIDLAGSERLSSSGAQGDRLRETQAINKSLACLGDVIFAVGNGDKHVPYRNSKLTHLLQDSLGGGNSKTLMFVCISPSPSSAQESLCSLRFATKVNSCQIGTAKRQSN
ncbi:kinesin-like nuclear fusion protein [Mycoemilia scoparia]|uniref:Kinesin-like protein n=1 Tax=Mycoemilia scoparia TaxID=417184 RepID=A0A9W8DTY6_9FUNG|nr:kinesin-like nuclear fusion protein [Mycoemilia scoparia]